MHFALLGLAALFHSTRQTILSARSARQAVGARFALRILATSKTVGVVSLAILGTIADVLVLFTLAITTPFYTLAFLATAAGGALPAVSAAAVRTALLSFTIRLTNNTDIHNAVSSFTTLPTDSAAAVRTTLLSFTLGGTDMICGNIEVWLYLVLCGIHVDSKIHDLHHILGAGQRIGDIAESRQFSSAPHQHKNANSHHTRYGPLFHCYSPHEPILRLHLYRVQSLIRRHSRDLRTDR